MAFRSSIPFTHERIGAAAIYCSDGRYNEQFDQFLHQSLRLPCYDRLTIPGGPACLAGHIEAYRDEEVLLEQLRFIITHHSLTRIILITHQDCGFYLNRLHISQLNLVERQHEDLARAAERLRTLGTNLEISAYYASLADERVTLTEVHG